MEKNISKFPLPELDTEKFIHNDKIYICENMEHKYFFKEYKRKSSNTTEIYLYKMRKKPPQKYTRISVEEFVKAVKFKKMRKPNLD